jgi:hypothetical protein
MLRRTHETAELARNMKNFKKRVILFSLTLSFICLAAGCAGPRILVPAPSAEMADNEAVETVKGVHVEVTGEGWKGDPGIYDAVTPIKISIKNNSGSPLHISYSNFSLVDANGNRYSVLPPYSLEEESYDRTEYSSFECSGFYVAPYYSPYYPYLHRYEGPFFYDPFYFDYYYQCWPDTGTELPKKEMLDEAIPEGVLWGKMSISGFVYFEKIEDSTKYFFRMDLVDAKEGSRFGEITVPMIIRKEQD